MLQAFQEQPVYRSIWILSTAFPSFGRYFVNDDNNWLFGYTGDNPVLVWEDNRFAFPSMTRKFQQNGRWAIFAMKIEVTCPSCKSLLRVDASHAGKQVRCPSCGSLSTIPSPENSEPILGENRPGPTRSDVLGSEDQPTTAPIHQAEHYPNYRIGPEDQPPAGVWQHSGNQQSLPTDGRDTTAMILGGLAIGSLFVCGCLTPALAGTGFFIARSSKGPSRSIAIVTNVIALVLWLLSVVFWIIVVLVM